MARLIVQPGSPAAWEIKLRPGANSLGRNPANDFTLDDPSVSGSHCQIVVEDGNAVIRDLGSTNGTYVNRAPVKEAVLQPGQTIHLGGLEMMFYSDAPAHAGAAPPAAAPRPAPGVPPLPPPRAAAPAGVARVSTTPTVALGPGRQPAPVAAPPVVAAPSSAVGSGPCKYHPKTPGRFFCSHCQLFFCELCVTSRAHQKFCRTCGTECVPVQAQIQRPAASKGGFYARFPSAFIYPFRGSGSLVLLLIALLLAGLNSIGMGGFFMIFVIILKLIVFGYLLTYMQCILHSTAAEEEEMPPLPGLTNFWEDIVLPWFRLIGLTLISFAPAIGMRYWITATQQESMGPLLLAVFALGYFYLPMAFLAVALLDTVAAANPLHVVPSIIKVPLEYLVTVTALAGVLGLHALGGFMLLMLFPRGVTTHSIPKLLEMFAAQVFWNLASLYLLTVGMRILGLLYLTRKDKLGWHHR